MKFTDTKIIGFVLILAFGGSSCQTLNCGCPMAEVKKGESVKERGSDREILRLGENERGRIGEGVIERGDERVTGRIGEGESGELEIAD
jgi:hypothetical protein